jgi:peptidoglycan/LPS O-acetylase OafA/YrhL
MAIASRNLPRSNNFDVLRLGAAIAVLLSHAVPLSYGNNAAEIIFRLSRQQATLGGLAVAVFFVISGYLITESFLRSRSAVQYISARILRLWPALLVNLIILATIIGPIYTVLPTSEYFAQPEVWHFLSGNLALPGSVASPKLGIFQNNPLPHESNGSLWTLKYEVECYVLVLVLGLTGMLRPAVIVSLWVAGLLGGAFWLGGEYVSLGVLFLAGSAIYICQVPMRGWIALTCAVLMLASMLTGGIRLATPTVGAYLVIYAALGMAPLRLPWEGRGDLSYGIYLWAFPVQQMVTHALGSSSSWLYNVWGWPR